MIILIAFIINTYNLFYLFACNLSLYEKPRQIAFKYDAKSPLSQMLVMGYGPLTPILYYEVLTITLPELETKKVVKVNWQNTKGEITVCFCFCFSFN